MSDIAASTNVHPDASAGAHPEAVDGSTSPQDVKSPGATSASAHQPPNPADPNAQITVRALVSTKEAGVIIGKGGANVAELREKTGVKAGVSKVVQGVHDRVLSVTGTLEGISQVSRRQTFNPARSS